MKKIQVINADAGILIDSSVFQMILYQSGTFCRNSSYQIPLYPYQSLQHPGK